MREDGSVRPGDVVNMTSVNILYGNPKRDYVRCTLKPNRGRRLVFMFLGDESLDGETDELDVVKRLYAMGWSHPEFKPAE